MKDKVFDKENIKAEEKQRLRRISNEMRDALSESERSRMSVLIAEGIKQLPEWREGEYLYTYVSMGNEPHTLGLINESLAEGKKVCVPKIFGKEMRFIRIKSADELQPGTWGIQEPPDSGKYERTPGLVIVPGVVFGEDFVRVGYGAGYYDRFFEGHTPRDGWFLAAVGYEFQVHPTLPAEDFDVFMDALITEERVLRR